MKICAIEAKWVTLGALLSAGALLLPVLAAEPETGDNLPSPGAAQAEMAPDTDQGTEDQVVQERARGSGPYRGIVARNAFRLKEPLPPLPPPTNPPPPPPEPPKVDVKLAGIAKIAGVKYAFLVLPDPQNAGQMVYPSLTDDPDKGQVRHNSGVEVREINLKDNTVRVVNGGVEATLNLKEHGLKAAPAPGAKPGQPGVPAPGQPRPPGVPTPAITTAATAAGAANAMAPSAEPLVFSRNPNRASGGTGSPVPAGGLQPVGGGSTGNGTVPVRPVRTEPAQAQPEIPRAQQYEVLIRQRQAAEAVGIQLPPIPGMPAEPPPVPAE